MTVTKSEGELRGFRTRIVETEAIRITVIPELGGKIASLLYKPRDREWLIDAGSRGYQHLTYGSTFTTADMSGWDECFPTIDACRYPGPGEYEGRRLPDHGEVWSIPWAVEEGEDPLRMCAKGVALPYRLIRTLSFITPNRFRLHYEVLNEGASPLMLFWTAHPQFAIMEETKLLLHPSMKEWIDVYGERELVNDPGSALLIPRLTGKAVKLYHNEQVADGFAGFYLPRSGEYLTFSFSPAEIPYLGLWVDEGALNDRYTCAIEPSTGFYDSLERAYRLGNAPILAGGEARSWAIEVEIGEEKEEQSLLSRHESMRRSVLTP